MRSLLFFMLMVVVVSCGCKRTIVIEGFGPVKQLTKEEQAQQDQAMQEFKDWAKKDTEEREAKQKAEQEKRDAEFAESRRVFDLEMKATDYLLGKWNDEMRKFRLGESSTPREVFGDGSMGAWKKNSGYAKLRGEWEAAGYPEDFQDWLKKKGVN